MKKENKVLLKVLVKKDIKKLIEKVAKERGISEAELVRLVLKPQAIEYRLVQV